MKVRAALAVLIVSCGPPPTPLKNLRGQVQAVLNLTVNEQQVTNADAQFSPNTNGGSCQALSATLNLNGAKLPQTSGGGGSSGHLVTGYGCKPADFIATSLHVPLGGDLTVTLTDGTDTFTISQPSGLQPFALVTAGPVHAGDFFVMTAPELYVHGALDVMFQDETNAVSAQVTLLSEDGGYTGITPSLQPGAYHVSVNEPFSYLPMTCDGFSQCEVKPDVIVSFPLQVQ